MIPNLLEKKQLILASASPRRSLLLKELGLKFEIRLKDIEEIYPNHLKGKAISEFLAKLKATPFMKELRTDEILITADTIVWFDNKALGKPMDQEEAKQMLETLSGKSHEVISSVAITSFDKQVVISDHTKVFFKELSKAEINYYVENYQPYDKAGGYGIQEWIGYIGINRIEGSYLNVVGFPIQKFYEALHKF